MQTLLTLRCEEDANATWREETRVYIVRAGGPGRPIKVGFTGDFRKRLSELQVGCPDPLVVIMTVEANRGLEKNLHQELAKWHLHGEWFLSEPEALLRLVPALVPYVDGANTRRQSRREVSARLVTYLLEKQIGSYRSWREHWCGNEAARIFPRNPNRELCSEWVGWLEVQRLLMLKNPRGSGPRPTGWSWFQYNDAVAYARDLGIKSAKEWELLYSRRELDARAPRDPAQRYQGEWRGWRQFLGLAGIGRGRPPKIISVRARGLRILAERQTATKQEIAEALSAGVEHVGNVLREAKRAGLVHTVGYRDGLGLWCLSGLGHAYVTKVAKATSL